MAYNLKELSARPERFATRAPPVELNSLTCDIESLQYQ